MIDIHSHLLFGVDDGPLKIEQSVRMVNEAEEAGVKVIIATPHLNEHSIDIQHIKENFNELVYRTDRCDVTLKLGFEVLLNPCVLKRFESYGEIVLAGTDYMLIEFPFASIPVYSNELLYRIHMNNIVPIIAHPERNTSFRKDFTLLNDILENGCLAQVDAASIAGAFGKKVKDFAKLLIEMDKVHFVASDAHNRAGYSEWYLKAYWNVVKWVGIKKADLLFCGNASELFVRKEIKERAYGA